MGFLDSSQSVCSWELFGLVGEAGFFVHGDEAGAVEDSAAD